jgi:hypothetical protein
MSLLGAVKRWRWNKARCWRGCYWDGNVSLWKKRTLRLHIHGSAHRSKANDYLSSNIILGVYLIIFGAGKPNPCTVQTISID